MSLFSGTGLLISLPGAEVERIDWRGSLAEPHEILGAPLSPELRLAVRVVRDEGMRRGMRVRCVARPEMFSSTVAVDWLRTQTHGFTQHLCLSDGVAVKTLHGYENHVFFYGLSLPKHVAALKKLVTRLPEILSDVRRQVNTGIALATAQRPYPQTQLVWTNTVQASDRPLQWPFFVNVFSAEDSVARIVQQGPVDLAEEAGFLSAHYVPLTATALTDRGFVDEVARLVQRVYFEPRALLILRLPISRPGEDPLTAGVAGILPALRASGVVIPRTIARNILFVTHDMEDYSSFEQLPPLQLTVHESFDFWRQTKSFYENACEVTLLLDSDVEMQGYGPSDVTSVYGPNAKCQRMPSAFVGSARIQQPAA